MPVIGGRVSPRPQRNRLHRGPERNDRFHTRALGVYRPKEEPSHDEDHFRRGDSRGGADACPLLVGAIPAEAQNLKMAQVDVQIGRDRDRRRGDQGTTVGVGPGGVTVGPKQKCRMVTTTVEQGGRTVTRKERRCD
jgi:hypothetical protein